MDILRPMLQIVVHGDGGVIFCGLDPAQRGIVLAVIAHQVDAVDPGIFLCQGADQLPALVRAAIIDEDDFIIGTKFGQFDCQAGCQFLQKRLAMVNWHYH
jgi:hypothetical protein